MQTWVDFATIKRSVGLGPVLRRYQVSLRRSGRDQYRGLCPIHRGEGRDAFHANLSRNIFHCFSCGAGGTVLDFVAPMEGGTLREAARKLARETAVPGRVVLAACRPKATVTRKSKAVSPLGFVLHGIDNAPPYLAARGIESATAQEFGIGVYRGSGSSPGGWSSPSTMPAENWSPTVAVRWMEPNRVTAFLPASRNRKSSSTCIAPWPPDREGWLSWKVSLTASSCTRLAWRPWP
jgi:hypothetical protein